VIHELTEKLGGAEKKIEGLKLQLRKSQKSLKKKVKNKNKSKDAIHIGESVGSELLQMLIRH
jgi:hypothetical protein